MTKMPRFMLMLMLPLTLLFLSGCGVTKGNAKAKQAISEKDKNRVFLYQEPKSGTVYLLTFEQLQVAGVTPGAIEGLQEMGGTVNYNDMRKTKDTVDLNANQPKK